MLDVSDFPIMDSECRTCPFGENGDRELRQAIELRVLTIGSQTCHHSGSIHGKPDTHLCRGARDHQTLIFYRMGLLEETTDECWSAMVAELKGRAK